MYNMRSKGVHNTGFENFMMGVVCEAGKTYDFDTTYRLLNEIYRVIYVLCFPI